MKSNWSWKKLFHCYQQQYNNKNNKKEMPDMKLYQTKQKNPAL